jgi:hypothetical protein
VLVQIGGPHRKTQYEFAPPNPFSASEQDILRVLADTLVPASEDGRMISAGELDLAGYVAANAEALLPVLKEVLAGQAGTDIQ